MLLVPKDWKNFQHYKDRCPPWIKLHKGLLDNRAFIMLPTASKALAPLMWLLASEHKDGVFDATVEELAFRLRMTEKEVQDGLTPLISKGFFLDASTMLAPCLQDAIPETEREAETKTEREADINSELSLFDEPIDSSVKVDRKTIPYQKIVNLYHEKLPTLPKVEKLTATRKSQIKARWNAGDLPDLETWEKYFDYVHHSKFLMGQVDPYGDRKTFIANLEWLTKESNYTKVFEGKYHG